MEVNTIKENYREVVHNFKSKLKLPIVLTYSIVLILYNWDIIYYLIFQKSDALVKMHYIRNIDNDWYHRILCPVLISIFYALLFPILQVGINYVFRWFKNQNNDLERNEELDNAKHRFQVQKEISGSQELEALNNQINSLIVDRDNLNNRISDMSQQNEKLLKENMEITHDLNEKIIMLNAQNKNIIKENTTKILSLNNEISNISQQNEKLSKENLKIKQELNEQIIILNEQNQKLTEENVKIHLNNNKDKIELLLPIDKILNNKIEEIINDYNYSFTDEQKVVFVDVIKNLKDNDYEYNLNKTTLFSNEINFIINYLEEKSFIKKDKFFGIIQIQNLGKEVISHLLKNHFKNL